MSNICSSKSHFVQPNVVCPAPAVPAVPTFWTPAIERLVQIMKRIFNSLREDKNSSIYAQKQTLQELYGKTMLIESIMNSRPILSVSKRHEVLMLTPKELMSPFLTSDQVETWVKQAILGDNGPPDISPVLKKTQLSKDSQLQETLLLFLQAQGIRYRPREGKGYSSSPPSTW